jgi:hypothetical protein
LAQLRITNQITQEELEARLSFQKLAFQNVLITLQGLGLIAAQNIVNGVIGILRTAIEKAIGFKLPA